MDASNPAPARRVDPRVERLKAEALIKIEGRAKQIQEMVDMVFSFDWLRSTNG